MASNTVKELPQYSPKLLCKCHVECKVTCKINSYKDVYWTHRAFINTILLYINVYIFPHGFFIYIKKDYHPNILSTLMFDSLISLKYICGANYGKQNSQ